MHQHSTAIVSIFFFLNFVEIVFDFKILYLGKPKFTMGTKSCVIHEEANTNIV